MANKKYQNSYKLYYKNIIFMFLLYNDLISYNNIKLENRTLKVKIDKLILNELT